MKVEEIVGQWIKVYGVKNKTAPPKRSGQVRFFFTDTETFKAGEFDVVEEVVRYAIHYGFIERRGSYYYVQGIEEGFQGSGRVVIFLRQHPEIIEELHKKILRLVFTDNGAIQEEKDEPIVLKEVGKETIEG